MQVQDYSDEVVDCQHSHTGPAPLRLVGAAALARAAAMLRTAADPERLRLLQLLSHGPRCVSELADLLNQPLPATSQRLRVLRSERLVHGARDGRHIIYSLADRHVSDLILAVLAHADEPSAPSPKS